MLYFLCSCRKFYQFEEDMEGKEHTCVQCGKINTIISMNEVIALLVQQHADKKKDELRKKNRHQLINAAIVLGVLIVLGLVFIILWNVLEKKVFGAVAVSSILLLGGVSAFLGPGILYVIRPKRDAVLKINGLPINMSSHALGVIFIILGAVCTFLSIYLYTII
jgi:predicted membrane channel-forming protein YqfA (hemolysin III family)